MRSHESTGSHSGTMKVNAQVRQRTRVRSGATGPGSGALRRGETVSLSARTCRLSPLDVMQTAPLQADFTGILLLQSLAIANREETRAVSRQKGIPMTSAQADFARRPEASWSSRARRCASGGWGKSRSSRLSKNSSASMPAATVHPSPTLPHRIRRDCTGP